MREQLTRILPADLEVRGADGRTVFGLVVPYGVEAEVSDGGAPYRERFLHGAFAKSIGERPASKIKLLTQHNRFTLPVGRGSSFREDRAGLLGEFLISKTQAGDDALELVRDGTLDGFSVGFAPIKNRFDGAVTERVEAALREVSLTPFPTYASAAIAGVRSTTPYLTHEAAMRRLALLERL